MSDIAELAKAALEALDRSTYGGSAEAAALQRIARENTFIREARMLVPELVTEVERLRAENERLRNTFMDAAIAQHREALKGMPDD